MKKRNKNKKPKTTDINLGTLYDFNKTLVEKEIECLSEEELVEKRKLVIDYIEEMTKRQDTLYFMLLNKELSDYTVFDTFITSEKQREELAIEMTSIIFDECFKNRCCSIKSIEANEEEKAIEIWVSRNGESYAYFLFDYSSGVIRL